MTKLSIVIPCYNVEKYLRQCLDSVINQVLKDIEIILIDDGGKDNCPQIIDEYAAKDSRIIAIHKENGGYGQSMNIGLERATGEYIGIVEPDDYIDTNMYEDLYNIAKQYDSDIVKSCFYDNIQTPQETRIKKANWKDYIPEDKSFTIKEYPYFLYYHPSIWSCIYKKEFLNKNNIRFVEAPGAGWTDNPFQVQTMCLAERINYTSNAYYYWRRLNVYESDDIKDYTIPFKRSDEIHKWLNENNIEDEQILTNLYRREFTYIYLVLGMKQIVDIKDCYKRIDTMCQRMNKEIVFNNKILRKMYNRVFNRAKLLRIRILLKRIKKSIIRLHISDREIYLSLFGNMLLDIKIKPEKCKKNVQLKNFGEDI